LAALAAVRSTLNLSLMLTCAALVAAAGSGCARGTNLDIPQVFGTLTVESGALPPAFGGQVYASLIRTSGGRTPYTYSLTAGSLPAGLTIASSTGVLSGVVSGSAAGVYSFSITATDSNGDQSEGTLSLLVTSAVSLTTTSLPPAQTSTSYALTLGVTGGRSPYTFSAAGLPSGFSINSSTGIISGVSVAESANTVDVIVTDRDGITASRSFAFFVAAPLSITTSSLPASGVGTAYSQSLTRVGGVPPFVFSLTGGSLPSGLSLSSAGVISGTPVGGADVATVDFPFAVTVADSTGTSASQSLNLKVTVPPRIISDVDQPLKVASTARAHLDMIPSRGGVGTLLYDAVGSTPNCAGDPNRVGFGVSGLCLDRLNGRIVGQATVAGTYNPSFFLTDSNGFVSHTVQKRLIVRSTALANPRINNNDNYVYLDAVNAIGGDARGYQIAWGNFSSFNGPRRDIVAIAHNQRMIYIARHLGQGQYTVYSSAVQPGGQNPYSVDVADINGDGYDDIAVGSIGSGVLNLYLSSGASYTAVPTPLAINFAAAGGAVTGTWNWMSPRIGNLNPSEIDPATGLADVKPDIVVNTYSGGQIVSLFWCGTGTQIRVAGALQTCGGTSPNRFWINNLASSGSVGNVVTNANLGFDAPIFLSLGRITGTWSGGAYGSGSFSADTPLDLVITHHNSSVNRFQVMRGNGDGTWDISSTTGRFVTPATDSTCPQALPAATCMWSPTRSTLADLNADGVLDIVGVYQHGPGTTIDHLTGYSGTSAPAAAVGSLDQFVHSRYVSSNYNAPVTPSTFNAQWPSAGDVNGDGLIDVLVTQQHFNVAPAQWRNSLQVFYNNGAGSYTLRSTASTGAILSAPLLSTAPFGSARPDLVQMMGPWGGVGLRLAIIRNTGLDGLDSFAPLRSWAVQSGNADTTTLGKPAVGDFNGDGRIDALVKLPGSVSVMLQQADGRFVPQADQGPHGDNTTGVQNWWHPDQLITSDFNGDGVLDYASANWNGGATGTVTISLGERNSSTGLGTGRFVSAQTTPIDPGCAGNQQGARGVAAADFNRDGLMDLAVGTGCNNPNSSQIHILIGRGNGFFQPAPVVLGGSGTMVDSLKAVDVSGDGVIDLVVANANRTLQLFRGLGDGTFTTPGFLDETMFILTQMPSGGAIIELDVADLNGDGVFDYTLAGAAAGVGPTITVAGAGSGTETRFDTGNVNSWSGDTRMTNLPSRFSRVVDWNFDGLLDVVWGKAGGLQIMLGDGLGNFNLATVDPLVSPLPGNDGDSMMATPADVNGDGLLDLLGLSTNGNQSGLMLLLNTSN
jgi:hypothetical protein